MNLKIVREEGGSKLEVGLHAIIWPDGLRWDEVNGFTKWEGINYKYCNIIEEDLVKDDFRERIIDKKYIDLLLGQIQEILNDEEYDSDKKFKIIEKIIKTVQILLRIK